jgi:hypothetical protein
LMRADEASETRAIARSSSRSSILCVCKTWSGSCAYVSGVYIDLSARAWRRFLAHRTYWCGSISSAPADTNGCLLYLHASELRWQFVVFGCIQS